MTTDWEPDLNCELSDDYKLMIDRMVEQEENGTAKYVSAEEIKTRFLKK
ncbi:MAG: hypothetical protein ABIN95_12375 [Mucilaginibacter sp.]